MRGERLGLRPHRIGDRELRSGPRLGEPIGAGNDRLGKVPVDRSPGLLDRPGRQPEIDRLAGVALDLLERPAQQDRELVGVGRLEAREPGLGEPISGSPTEW
jgi:hypothetical protein